MVVAAASISGLARREWCDGIIGFGGYMAETWQAQPRRARHVA